MDAIKVGDLVEETDTDSGVWLVTAIYRNTLRKAFAAKLVLPGTPTCTTHVSIEKLKRVGPWR
jgi:hypothetical protein